MKNVVGRGLESRSNGYTQKNLLGSYRDEVATVLAIFPQVIVGSSIIASWNLLNFIHGLGSSSRLLGSPIIWALPPGLGSLRGGGDGSLSAPKQVAQRTLSSTSADSTPHFLWLQLFLFWCIKTKQWILFRCKDIRTSKISCGDSLRL